MPHQNGLPAILGFFNRSDPGVPVDRYAADFHALGVDHKRALPDRKLIEAYVPFLVDPRKRGAEKRGIVLIKVKPGRDISREPFSQNALYIGSA